MTTLVSVCEAQDAPSSLNLTQIETHHIAELNSNQPYVAGYATISPSLREMKALSGATIRVSFLDTDSDFFLSNAWLGAGLFLQGQEYRTGYVFVDYAFYVMLVLDATGKLFLDIGLHQTREASAPIQMPTAELIYAYTWQISGIDPSTTATLGAEWDSEGFVHYWIFAEGFNVTLPPVNVAGLPNCETIQRQFWSGNMRAGGFPFGHYVYYTQFGVISPTVISDTHWSARLSGIQMMKKEERKWIPVDLAVTTQGNICYLDWDWMWGGAPYNGVSAKYYRNPFENPYEAEFFYSGQTLSPGTVLWHYVVSESETAATIAQSHTTDISQNERLRIFSIGMTIIIAILTMNFALHRFGGRLLKPLRAKKDN